MAAPGDGGGELFTRGGHGPDLRGQSMVAKHQDNLQKEKERKAMEKLRLVLPQISPALHALALQEFNWDEEQATQALRKFNMVKAAELKALQKERQRHAEKKASRSNKKRRVTNSDSGSSSDNSGSDSESGSSSGSGSDSDDSREDRKKSRRSGKKRSRSEKRDKKDSRSKKRRRERKEKDRDRDRRRKEKKSKKEKKEQRRDGDRNKSRDKDKAHAKNPHALQEYGKYGIIRETDLYNKRPEFMLWASEVKKADVEIMPRFEEKELFKTYMEDYNTGTLPHKKYYDLETYERQQAAKGASGEGGGGQERMAFDDEAERRKEIAIQRQKDKEERLRAAYEELQTTDKAEDMRQQELMRAKMALAYRTGDVKEAQRLAERLKPDDKTIGVAPPPRAPATGT